MDMILKTTDLCKNLRGEKEVNNLCASRPTRSRLSGGGGAGWGQIRQKNRPPLRPPPGGPPAFGGHPWKRNDLEHIGALIEMPPLYENLTAYENLKVRTHIARPGRCTN